MAEQVNTDHIGHNGTTRRSSLRTARSRCKPHAQGHTEEATPTPPGGAETPPGERGAPAPPGHPAQGSWEGREVPVTSGVACE